MSLSDFRRWLRFESLWKAIGHVRHLQRQEVFFCIRHRCAKFNAAAVRVVQGGHNVCVKRFLLALPLGFVFGIKVGNGIRGTWPIHTDHPSSCLHGECRNGAKRVNYRRQVVTEHLGQVAKVGRRVFRQRRFERRRQTGKRQSVVSQLFRIFLNPSVVTFNEIKKRHQSGDLWQQHAEGNSPANRPFSTSAKGLVQAKPKGHECGNGRCHGSHRVPVNRVTCHA